MTGTKLRWCTIDGTTWTASQSGTKYEIELSQTPGLPDNYIVVSYDIENGIGWDYEGQFDTLAKAKAEIEGRYQ